MVQTAKAFQEKNPEVHVITFFEQLKSHLTQQDPQEPWSLISFRVGQLGHCSLESNCLGSFTPPAY